MAILGSTSNEAALGPAWARLLANKDHDGLLALLHPEVDFRAMTPNRFWESAQPQGVIDAVSLWFEDSDLIEAVESVDTGSVAGCQRVAYRLRVRNDDGLHLVEQQAYLEPRDGRIGWLRIMCSGYRRIDA